MPSSGKRASASAASSLTPLHQMRFGLLVLVKSMSPRNPSIRLSSAKLTWLRVSSSRMSCSRFTINLLFNLFQMTGERLLCRHLSEHPITLHLVDSAHRDADVHGHVPRLPRAIDARDRLLGELRAPARRQPRHARPAML